MVNVHDKAHILAKSIKDSVEYKEFKEAKKELETNEATKNMVIDFEKKQFEYQTKQMSGEEVTEEETQKIMELYSIVTKDVLASKYINAQMKFAILMQDVNKIIADALEEL